MNHGVKTLENQAYKNSKKLGTEEGKVHKRLLYSVKAEDEERIVKVWK